MATGSDMIQRALESLRSTVTPQDQAAFESTNFRDVYNEARRIEREQGARTSLTNMRRIEPALQALQNYAGVIDTFCQGFTPMAWVWGPIKLMLTLASQHLEIIKKLLEALQNITDVLPRIDKLKKAFPNDAEFQRMLGLIYEDLIEFFQRTYKFFRRRAWAQWFEASWRLFNRRFSSIINKLAARCELMDKQAAATHYAEMKEERDRRRLEDAEYEKVRQQRMTEEVISWLSGDAESQEDYLHNQSDNRQPGTCNWVLSDSSIQSWIEEDGGSSLAWMTGIPGAGKSIICSFLIDHLQAPKSISVLYFFCRQSSTADIASLLRTFAVQCLRQNRDFASLVHEIFLGNGNKSAKEMKTVLSKLLASVSRTRILVDGLDEFEPEMQTGIIKVLTEILSASQSTSGHSCKLLISSRKLPQIEKALPKNKIHVSLDSRPEGAITLFIKTNVAALREYFEEFDDSVFETVTVELKSKAKGMFLWVRLISEMLKSLSTQEEFEQALDKLPDGLDQAYGLILKRLDKLPRETRSRAIRVLYWLCAAYVPLDINEVADGVALKPGQVKLTKKTRSQNLKRDLCDICAPLVEESGDGTLTLVHFSAKEYLLDQRSGQCREISDMPYLKILQAHHDIGYACITNLTAALCFVPRHSGGRSESDFHGIIVRGELGLQKYAHRFWTRHVLDYLRLLVDALSPEMELLKMLGSLASVRKNELSIAYDPSVQRILASTPEIQKLPIGSCRDLLLKALLLDARRKSRGSISEEYDAQQHWNLQEDLTFLSLIDSKVQKLTEELLCLNPTNLPSHIDPSDFHRFAARFKFVCRISGCSQPFNDAVARDDHEKTHAPTHRCTECDFSTCGFKSRKDLQRHMERYHLSVEDLAVPETIHIEPTSSYSSQTGRLRPTTPERSYRLNARGQKVLEHGFRKALDDFSEQMTRPTKFQGSTAAVQVSDDLISHIETMGNKIKNHSYQSLRDFEDDLRVPVQLPPGIKKLDLSQVTVLCEQAFRSVLNAHPLFSIPDADTSPNQDPSNSLYSFAKEESNASSFRSDGSIASNERRLTVEIADENPTTYWSKAEKHEFPTLIQRFGKDCTAIADYLKTKTPQEVQRYLAQLIEANDTTILALLKESNGLVGSSDSVNEASLGKEMKDRTDETSFTSSGTPYYWGQMNPQLLALAQALAQTQSEPESSTATQTLSNNQIEEQTESSSKSIVRKYVRKRPRVRCPYCKEEKILSNENAYVRHVRTFHQPTREVWVCKDNSFSGQLLKDCDFCGSKAYSTKQLAVDHLCTAHFGYVPQAEFLEGWVEKMTRRNPKFQEVIPNDGNDGEKGARNENETSKVEDEDGSGKDDKSDLTSLRSQRLLPELLDKISSPHQDSLGHLARLSRQKFLERPEQHTSGASKYLIALPVDGKVDPAIQLPSIHQYLEDQDQRSLQDESAIVVDASSLRSVHDLSDERKNAVDSIA